jgi:hypothetical protein
LEERLEFEAKKTLLERRKMKAFFDKTEQYIL